MQSLRSPDVPPRHTLTLRGGAHRRLEPGRGTRWWVVAAATLLLVTGTGLATAELTIAPEDTKNVAGDGNTAPETIGDSDSTSSTETEDVDKGDKPSPSKTKESESEKPTEDDETDTKPPDEFADFRSGVVKLVNEERAAAGCGKVSSNSKLVAAATGHSKDMASNNYFDHTSQDGRTFTDRAGEQGYNAAIGENIAAGQTSAESVMDAWMNSEGHRANILNCDARAIGMGVARNGDGSLYWTQMFGSQ